MLWLKKPKPYRQTHIRFEDRGRYHHQYRSEHRRTSCNISDNVCGDLQLERYCFCRSRHNVLNVTLSDKYPLHTLVAGTIICVRASLLSITMSFDAVSSRNRDDLIYRKLKRRATAKYWTSIYTQIYTKTRQDMSTPTDDWRLRRTEHFFNAAIVTDITTRN